VPARARLAVLLAASFIVAAVFFASLGGRDDGSPSSAAQAAQGAETGFNGAVRPASLPPVAVDMVDEQGKRVTSADLRGKVSVVTFLYTTCEDTCPLTAQQIRGAMDELGHDVPVFAVATDPPRDTPALAERFLREQRMVGRMRWLLGPRQQLSAQWKQFGIQRQTDELEHSASTVLIDKRGRQRVSFPANQLIPEQLAQDIALLERES
jgi:protein SCO1/2